jgi:predicted Zn finger-like uncharacterized protein
MIVTCSQCHARFRVADEKVGPRGAKLRCSRCHTVFLVKREGQAVVAPPAPPPAAFPLPRPGIDLDLETGVRPVAGADPFAPAGAPAEPYARSVASTDPFAAAGGAAFGSVDPLGADPFGPVPATEPPPASVAGLGPAVPGLGDPFVAAVLPRPDRVEPRTALVTDLSDLARPAPSASGAPAMGEPGAFHAALASDEPAGRESALALEDRTPSPPPAGPPPLPQRPPPLPVPGAAGFAGDDPLGFGPEQGDEYRGGDFPGAPDEPLVPASAPDPMAAEVPAAPSPAAPARVRPPAAARRILDQEPDSDAEGRRRKAATADRIRAVAVNALALVALVVLSLGLLLMWRGRAPLEAGTLRPSALLDALGGRDDAPFRTDGVSNGLYERASGAPIFFVRGRVVSRAGAAVRGVRVSVELLRGAVVLARGEALAGAVPTPEELWSAGDGPELARIARAAETRAPRAIRPGDAVPFLVVIPDRQADLSGATLRVVAASVKAADPGVR